MTQRPPFPRAELLYLAEIRLETLHQPLSPQTRRRIAEVSRCAGITAEFLHWCHTCQNEKGYGGHAKDGSPSDGRADNDEWRAEWLYWMVEEIEIHGLLVLGRDALSITQEVVDTITKALPYT